MVPTLIVSSTARYAGKSGVCLALLRELEQRGRVPGYFKPYGTMPMTSDDVLTDEDAVYLNRQLSHPSPADVVCGVIRTRSFVEELLAGRAQDLSERVLSSYAAACGGHDVMVVEGPSATGEGAAAGLSIGQVAKMLDAPVLVVDRLEGMTLPDLLLHARQELGDRLRGAVFNGVRDVDRATLTDHVIPYLEKSGVRVFGMVEQDPFLSSVTVGEIVAALHGAVLCAEENLDEPVETFMVGAMGQDKALRFFRRKGRKAVITGGDRSDVQLAALETSTSMLVLTGNAPPSAHVISRADELGVPVVMVDMDTLSAVETLEAIMGHVRLHGDSKADKIRAMFAQGVAIDELLAAFGI